ncbi:adenylate kinase 7 [Octopus bimaculoides]|uniref:Adenylate kinase 7 n=1 Tax=Octopus bimaculoides TaxID=37653 RepID=A0A0L8GGK1_OCTBM|nr:adenylate kinase 7 [Octopus bimaculoides]|eukprot:XP_014781306.1 PREDICTED: adenylate kinase 7-like [Octopus bimaculoides]
MANAERTPKTIFINNVDLFHGWNIAEHLSTCQVGATLDEEDEEIADEEADRDMQPTKDDCYEVYGTISSKENDRPKFVKEIIEFSTRDELYKRLIEFDIIVYDITRDHDQIDEATWVVSELQADLEKIVKPKIFILISSVLTWAKTKPTDVEDPDIPFTKDDYRRRRPHSNFKDHISAEKTVIKLGKGTKKKLNTCVLAVGATYGGKEDIFHYWFKSAWHNEPVLKCIGSGNNIVPTIHIKDLAAVIQNIADASPQGKYIIAKDDSMNTLEEIIKSISKALTTGKIQKIPPEDFLSENTLTQAEFDTLQVNIRMESIIIKDSMKIEWICESGIVDNMSEMVKEYKESRKLLPLRICILGPPGAGKTTVTEQICTAYKLHHIKLKEVISDYIQNLVDLEQKMATANFEHDSDAEEEEDENRIEDPTSRLYDINENKEQNNQRLDDNLLVMMVKDKLMSKRCQNQGFVLDGFPKSIDQAKLLYEDEEGEEEADDNLHYNRLIMPEFIFSLDADDNFLSNRIMRLPEQVVAGTHNTEEGFQRRITEFRANNTEDNTVLNFFDELEFHPERIDVTQDKSIMMKQTVDTIQKIIKDPRNYGLSKEELEKIKRLEVEARLQREEKERIEKEERETAEVTERKRNEEDWAKKLSEVKQQEYELLQARSLPLRNYLMTHIMPTLSNGLIDCCKVRPEDPVDYLAEYIFKNNPQVD